LSSEDPQVSQASHTPEPAAPAAAAPVVLQGPKAFTRALAVIVADQISKFWILGSVFPAACQPFVATPAYYTPCSIPVFGPLNLSMVWNQGVSFGLFRGEADWVRWVLVAFSLCVAVALGVWARRIDRPLLGAAIGLIMGGAIGNLIDRVRLGAVADFLDLQALYFPWVFNIADSAITIGVVLLLLDSLRRDVKP
jgi:signal peptidase II